MTPPRLLVCGSVNHDILVSLDAMPAPGETVVATASSHGLGGKGANQALAAAALGHPTELLAAVGQDPDGDSARAELQSAGVGVDRMQISAKPTGQALVLLEPSGENRIVVIPGANADLDVSASAEAFRGAGAVLCQLESPLPAVRDAFTLGRECGALTVLNAAPALAAAVDLLPLVDVLIVNEGEAALLSGQPDDHGVEAMRRAAAQLHRAGPSTVVITRGGRGAMLLRGDHVHEQQAFPVETIDTTGAGDCFVGALTQQLLSGEQPQAALRLACAAGALATTARGAAARPTMAQIHTLL